MSQAEEKHEADREPAESKSDATLSDAPGHLPAPPPRTVVAAVLAGGVIGMALFIAGVISAVGEGLLHWATLTCLFGSLILYAGLLAWQKKAQAGSPTIRRTLYGFNVFLMCGLLIVALGILNVLTYKFGAEKIDLTSNAYFSLADQTKEVLASLDRPVQINVLFPESVQDALGRDVPYVRARILLEEMLDLYHSYHPSLRIEYIDPYGDPTKGRQILQEFPDALRSTAERDPFSRRGRPDFRTHSPARRAAPDESLFHSRTWGTGPRGFHRVQPARRRLVARAARRPRDPGGSARSRGRS
jgi:hypothetical protein